MAFGRPVDGRLFVSYDMYIQMRYEWDEGKNRENQRKHPGVSFELAMLVFKDEDRLITLDRVDENGEQRWHAFPPQRRGPVAGTPVGAVSPIAGTRAVLLVVHVYREDHNGEEIIRIISARRAGPDDVRRYKEQTVD